MLIIRSGSRIHRLLTLLSVAGELPVHALSLIGVERDLKKLVHKLESVHDFRFSSDGRVYSTKLFIVNGKKGARYIRLYKGALDLLPELHQDALTGYMRAFKNHSFSGDIFHQGRNFRTAETLAVCEAAGIEIRPYLLPVLQMDKICIRVPSEPSFYIARDFKSLDKSEFNKTMFTRLIGALFYPGGCYAVYNTRGAEMKWSGIGELKAKLHLTELIRMNAGLPAFDSALLLGTNPDIALQTLRASEKTHRLELRFDGIYPHVHFIPMNAHGIRLLKMLVLSDWNEKMLSALFAPELRPRGFGFMEYDAVWDGKYIFSHLDSDIARLIRFRQALHARQECFEVLCFSWQVSFLREYLGSHVILKQISMETLERELLNYTNSG